MDNRKILHNFQSSPFNSMIKSILNEKVIKVREDILLGEIYFQYDKFYKNYSAKKRKNDNEIDEYFLSGINDQIIKNMHKSFKISVAKNEKKKLVLLIKFS